MLHVPRLTRAGQHAIPATCQPDRRSGPDAAFLFGSPPWKDFGDAADATAGESASATRPPELLTADREGP